MVLKSWVQYSNENKLHIKALLIMSILLMSSTATSVSASGKTKPTSLTQQLMARGTHIWFKTATGKISENSVVNEIVVLHSGKSRVYQIFDKQLTLGKLRQMNDNSILKLAKSQNKQYATSGMIMNIKQYLAGKASAGQDEDLNEDVKAIVDGRINVYYSAKTKQKANSYSYAALVPKIKAIYPTVGQANQHEYTTLTIMDFSDTSKTTSKFGTALIKHVQDTKYQTPIAYKVHVKQQKGKSTLTFKSAKLFNVSSAEQNAYQFAIANKKDMLKLIGLSVPRDYGADTDAVFANKSAAQRRQYQTTMTKVVKERLNLSKTLFQHQYSDLTKGVYGYHQQTKSITLEKSINTKIAGAQYQGYQLKNKGALVTKIQK